MFKSKTTANGSVYLGIIFYYYIFLLVALLLLLNISVYIRIFSTNAIVEYTQFTTDNSYLEKLDSKQRCKFTPQHSQTASNRSPTVKESFYNIWQSIKNCLDTYYRSLGRLLFQLFYGQTYKIGKYLICVCLEKNCQNQQFLTCVRLGQIIQKMLTKIYFQWRNKKSDVGNYTKLYTPLRKQNLRIIEIMIFVVQGY